MSRNHRGPSGHHSEDPFGAREILDTAAGDVTILRIDRVKDAESVATLPYSVKILLEALLRHLDGRLVTEDDVARLAAWTPRSSQRHEIPFLPARVLMQDFTGVPAVVDLAAMRGAIQRLGGDPRRVNPVIPVDLVIDHSVQVDRFRDASALQQNAEIEFARNRERYEFLRWGATAFDNFRVVPPATGIVHQVNLEYLARVVHVERGTNGATAFPDSLVGTDSHTTMINGLGVLGWGVGGIEAEATMLGQPLAILTPRVVGMRLEGELPRGATATDLVLTIVETLRSHGVVGTFVEFHGPGVANLSLADRATIANMAPEYGATIGFFPVDQETLRYLRETGRDADLVDLVERYTKAQGMFLEPGAPEPEFDECLVFDMGDVVPCLAGPRRPQDRVPLSAARSSFRDMLDSELSAGRTSGVPIEVEGNHVELDHGSVVIAAITSCTNTSNPSVMIGGGLLAKKAALRGLKVPSYVKTSLAPGSRVVSQYLTAAGLLPYLEQLGFFVVGYGCTTCIGNSGPLPEPVARAIRENDLVAVSVLSGNRNFEGRISPLTRANYLASPPLVVAYALAGTMDIDLTTEPIGFSEEGQPVRLQDIWPSPAEIREAMNASLRAESYTAEYANVFEGNDRWNAIAVPEGESYAWNDASTYIKEPSFFEDLPRDAPGILPLRNARALAVLGDSVTTDHISPAGAIPCDGPAGRWLIAHGVDPSEFNSYGSRRGNHEVMIRGTFGNIRLRNQLAPGTEGGVTTHQPSGEQMSIFAASERYRAEGTPLLVLAGKEYGTGSSRDWAAKGTLLLGIRAVIAESYERIHRSNLLGMGVLPFTFLPGASRQSLGLDGTESFDFSGLDETLSPGQRIGVTAKNRHGATISFDTILRLDSPVEIEYASNRGILQTVLRSFLDA